MTECVAFAGAVRLLVEEVDTPVQLLGASRQKRKVRIQNEGPESVYLVPNGSASRSNGMILTPVDDPLTLDWQAELWVLAENEGSSAMVAVFTETGAI